MHVWICTLITLPLVTGVVVCCRSTDDGSNTLSWLRSRNRHMKFCSSCWVCAESTSLVSPSLPPPLPPPPLLPPSLSVVTAGLGGVGGGGREGAAAMIGGGGGGGGGGVWRTGGASIGVVGASSITMSDRKKERASDLINIKVQFYFNFTMHTCTCAAPLQAALFTYSLAVFNPLDLHKIRIH